MTAPSITLDQARQRVAVSVPEAAALLGVSESMGWRMARTGELPTIRAGTAGKRGRVLVPVAALERLFGEPGPSDSASG